MRDEKNNPLTFCFSGAGFAGVVYLSASLYLTPGGQIARVLIQAGLLAAGVFFALLLTVNIPAIVTHWLEHRAYWRTLGPREAITPEPTIITQSPSRDEHAEAWRAYWLAALDYAGEVGGVSYQRTADFFGNNNPTWRECFALPLVRAGCLNPVIHGITTTCAEGWSVEKIRLKIDGGWAKLESPPFAPPIRFQNHLAQSKRINDSVTAFAPEAGKQ